MGTRSQLLWDVLVDAYARLGTDRTEPEPVQAAARTSHSRQRRRPDHAPPPATHQWTALRPLDTLTEARESLGPAGPVRDIVRADHCLGQRAKVELLLTRMQPLTGRSEQHSKFGVGVCRTDVLDLHNLAVHLETTHRDRSNACGPFARTATPPDEAIPT